MRLKHDGIGEECLTCGLKPKKCICVHAWREEENRARAAEKLERMSARASRKRERRRAA